ncbi:MAG: hypothetical protein ACJAZN_003055 [Planctomycetota bacterium]|jgi:hypothetical protein
MKKHHSLSQIPHAAQRLTWGLALGLTLSASVWAGTAPQESTTITPHLGIGSQHAFTPDAGHPELSFQDDGESTTLGGVEFAHLTFDDAVSRAERTKKLLVIFWAGKSPSKEADLGNRLFGDKGVQAWMAENATAVRINALDRKKDAKKNGLSEDLLPTVDILDMSRGGRIERLRADADATMFLAAVYGAGSAERPEGDGAREPFRWLAWANANFRNTTNPEAGEKAVAGYDWCLLNGNLYRPGFRAKYLEFLLQRIANCKQRSPNAVEALYREHRHLAGKLSFGSATEADVYELTRVDFWMRQELMTRDLFVSLGNKGEPFSQYRLWLFPTVVPVLGRFEQYDEILAVVGDQHLAMFQERIDSLTADDEAEADDDEAPAASPAASPSGSIEPNDAGATESTAKEGEEKAEVTALDYALGDSRSDIIDDASWVYEALLKVGRGKDAHDLMELITTTFPVNKSFGLFTERALRVQIWAAAAEIADLGMAVLDERGQKRMQRLLKKIPADTSKAGGGK